MKTAVRLVGVFLLGTVPALAGMQHQHEHAGASHAGEQLGVVVFPTSCAPSVQKSVERGVALLHSFWYEEAEKQFAQIAQQDPACAMAHWGLASSLYHQLWDRPKGARLERGAAAIAKARALQASTERERGYIDALAAFYEDAGTKDHPMRAKAYSAAMEDLYRRFPTDAEAGAFFGLALLASTPSNDETFANPTKAVQVLMPLMRAQPDHPGLAHYIIHACDNPTMAAQGLEAARRYARIAPSSPHAVHMPSHIFSRLGLWQESVQSNLASLEASRKADEQKLGGSDHALHAMQFLNYAYLQTGREDEARTVVAEAIRFIGDHQADAHHDHDMADYFQYVRAHFPAMYALELRDWAGAAALEPPAGAKPWVQGITYWARGVGAARAGKVAEARQHAQRFTELVDQIRKSSDAEYAVEMDVPGDELRGWVAFAEGATDEALRLMRTAADRQDARGKGEVAIPAREMLGDMLVLSNRPGEALVEYEASMRVDPNRFGGLAGAARAAELAGKPDRARSYYTRLLENCRGSESGRSELHQARAFLGKTD
jgi:tetratricopeptide (TPR) repeat protein